MQVDCQTLDPHRAGASDDPLAARPAVIAVLAGFSACSSRDTELVPFRVAHHHPPLAVLLDAPDRRRAGLGQFRDLGLPRFVALAGAQVEMEAVLYAFLLPHPQEKHARGDAL